MSSSDWNAFPVAIAWSLTDGRIKSTLIQPEQEWLEQEQLLSLDPDQLFMEGHSAKSVLHELVQDLESEPLYSADIDQVGQALDQLYQSLEGHNDLPLLPLRQLLEDVEDEIEPCREECQSLLQLDPSRADEQVRLWLEVYVRLMQN
ncbi:hypothetical protein DV711_07300 [Motiliproteus coralliicola]|uniref:Uncharacterized protein n=1 Tax=Motiliproteus coralliicola TaxID=2283196 RepID=A0A369WP70_9GAMM|nr:hypothetical protein [Motiliproteus coralliicola]RDE22404.1 hypothetical protein DV711_07300 [Motiliproteus coralliicola]